jgi:cytochrome c peroxidase
VAIAAEPYRLEIPLGLDEFVPIPADNPLTTEKIELGRRLFFDPQLSRDGTVSCATCHVPIRVFADAKAVATGVHGRVGRRNVPSLFNRAYQRSFFWDGREDSLERQVLMPIQDPKEMDLTLGELEERLLMLSASRQVFRGKEQGAGSKGRVVPDASHDSAEDRSSSRYSYADQFARVFDELPSATNAGRALASYVRALISANSDFDRFQAGDTRALSESAKRGLQLFRGKGNCTSCHSGPLLSDQEFHNTGVSWGREPLDLGRFEITGKPEDRGRFQTPSLRDVALTAPYMHDGSIATLAEVIEFYSRGGNSNPNRDRELRPANFRAEEKADLLAFLGALSGTP